MKPAKIVGNKVKPIWRISHNVPRADPCSLCSALSPTSTFNGAPSKIPKPTPANILATTNVGKPDTTNGKSKKPATPMTPATINVFAAPYLSVKYPPNPAPIPEDKASGVNQNPAFSTGTCNTCSTSARIKITPDKKPHDNIPKKRVI